MIDNAFKGQSLNLQKSSHRNRGGTSQLLSTPHVSYLRRSLLTGWAGFIMKEGRKEDPRTFSFQTAGMQAHQIFGAKQRTAQSSWYWHETKKAAVVKQKKVHHWLTYINIVITKVAWSMAGLTTCKLSPNENAHIKKNIFTLLPYRRKNLWI